MRIHLSGIEPNHFYDEITNAGFKNHLYSFYICRSKAKRDLLKSRWKPGIKIFMDSGGFSARMRGVQIDIKDYVDFLNENADYIEIAANLDTNNVQETLDNQAFLTSNSKAQILPVYHVSDYVNPKYKGLIDEFIEKYDYIGVGGMAGVSVPEWKQHKFLSYVFSKTRDKVKVHGFGITSESYLKKFPFFSVDSTSWQAGMRFGYTKTPDGKTVSYKNRKHAIKSNIPANLIDADYKQRLSFDLLYWKDLEDRISNLWELRGVKWER